MAKKREEGRTDFQECREKIQSLLAEYNCELLDCDDRKEVFLWDKDTNQLGSVYWLVNLKT